MNWMNLACYLCLWWQVDAATTKHKMLIQNGDLPACKNCLFYKASSSQGRDDFLTDKCTKYGSKNIVTGRIEFIYAMNSRISEKYCGIKGNSYVPITSVINPSVRIPTGGLVGFILRWIARRRMRQAIEKVGGEEEDNERITGDCDF
jgi:hypothetical protein